MESGLIRKDPDQGAARSARFHPGGSLGRRLLTVKDLMRTDTDTRSRVEKLARDGAGVDILVGALGA